MAAVNLVSSRLDLDKPWNYLCYY